MGCAIAVGTPLRCTGLRTLFCLLLRGTFLGPRQLALLLAGVALAADRLQVLLEVILAVVVVDLFARLDVLGGADEHPAIAGLHVGFGVRPASVIDVTG